MISIKRTKVLGVPVDIVSMVGAIDFADRLFRCDSKGIYILAANPEKVIVLEKDSFLREMFEKAPLLIPDVTL